MSKFTFLKFCLVAFVLGPNLYAQQYISPGVRIGYDFNGHVSFGLKISVGVYDKDSFINLTWGKKFLIGEKKTIPYSNYSYFDLQMGQFSGPMGKRKIQLFFGGGIGLIFYRGADKNHWAPRITTFAGNLVFTALDVNFIKEKKFHPDLGIQLVLPLPFGKKPL